jgi:hypothetical protein
MDTLIEGFIYTVILVLVVAFLGALGYGVYYVSNYSFRPVYQETGTVLNLHKIPAHYENQTTYNVALKMPTVTTVYVDNAFEAKVKDDKFGLTDTFDVDESLFNRLKAQDKVTVFYKIGRINQKVNFTQIAFLN